MKARGLRNNNPLNIRHGVSRWEGRTAVQTDVSFVTFRTLAYGYRAAWKLMENYRLILAKEGKPYTLYYIIHRWAPPADGNDTAGYLYSVVRQTNGAVKEHMPLPPCSTPQGARLMAKVLAAMTCVECGIHPDRVSKRDILEGYRMAFPEAKTLVE